MTEGVREVAGPGDNPRVVEYHAATSGKFVDDEVPWCSSFVNWCMEQSSIGKTGSARARSWLAWGKRINPPPVGAIAILQRGVGPQPGPEVIKAPGHVGFYVGDASPEEILLLGGNQDNEVNVRVYPRAAVLAFQWPG
jgi:uncharacterized protein (TIGR02594 family)